MRRLDILHLSDLHICTDNIHDFRVVREALFSDLDRLQSDGEANIRLVCFTGDLVQRADMGFRGRQFDLALDEFIDPLLAKLGLSYSDFHLCAGNHDVDRNQIADPEEAILQESLASRETVNGFIDNCVGMDDPKLARLRPYNEFCSILGKDVGTSGLCSACVSEIDGIRIGVVSLNSVWRSGGWGTRGEGRKLLLGERQVQVARGEVREADLKIALFHHPVSWLVERDALDIESDLTNFDIVLTGHLHNSSEHQISHHGETTLYCASGALHQGGTRYNGYQVIQVDPMGREATVLFREYISDRRRFDRNLQVFQDGRATYTLNSRDPVSENSYRMVQKCSDGFTEKVASGLLPTMLESPRDLDELFVEPHLSSDSEYQKEDENRKSIKTQDIIEGTDNIALMGKERSGKTTLLQFICIAYMRNYDVRRIAPFIVSAGAIPDGKNRIEKAMASFVASNANYGFTLPPEAITAMLQSGKCLVIFDDLVTDNSRSIETIKDFCKSYPSNRFIMSFREDIYQTLRAENLPDLGCEIRPVYLHSMNRKAVRTLVGNWHAGRLVEDIDKYVDRIILHLTKYGLPRTPWIISLMLALEGAHKQAPINEAAVMTGFVELLLEKLNPDEFRSDSYDYSHKQKYLSFLAWNMAKSGIGHLTEEQFITDTKEWFSSRKLDLKQSKFETLFFAKGILMRYEGNVYFRFRGLLDYFLAVGAQTDQSIVDWMLDDLNYLGYSNALCLLAGLSREREDLLLGIEAKLAPLLDEGRKHLDTLRQYDLGDVLDITEDREQLKKEVQGTRMSQDAKDSMKDFPDSNSQLTTQIEQKKESPRHPYLEGLLLYSRLLRNNESLLGPVKAKALQQCVDGYCILLAIAKDAIEQFNLRTLREHADKAGLDGEKIDQEAVDLLQNILKITAPIVIQNLAADYLGTQKLAGVIDEAIKQENDEYRKFMLVFLYSDLKIPGYLDAIGSFLASIHSRDVLILTDMKLRFYFALGHAEGVEEDRLLDLLLEAERRRLGASRVDRGKAVEALRKIYPAGRGNA